MVAITILQQPYVHTPKRQQLRVELADTFHRPRQQETARVARANGDHRLRSVAGMRSASAHAPNSLDCLRLLAASSLARCRPPQRQVWVAFASGDNGQRQGPEAARRRGGLAADRIEGEQFLQPRAAFARRQRQRRRAPFAVSPRK